MDRLSKMEEIAELIVSNTIYVPPEKQHPYSKIKVLSIAPMLAEVVRCIHRGESISPILRPALPSDRDAP